MLQSSRLIRPYPERAWMLLLLIVLGSIAAVPPPASADVSSRSGPVELEPHVYPIFWGNAWNSGTPATERGKVMAMYEDLNSSIGSSWQSILTQYWAPKTAKGEEATPFGFVSSSVLVGGAYTDSEGPPANVALVNMEAEIQKAIEAKSSQENPESWPKSVSETNVNYLFPIFFPAGTTWGAGHDKTACGVHTFRAGSYTYAWIAWEWEKAPGVMIPCSATLTGAHEYAEAVTDPYGSGSSAWWVSVSEKKKEIADLCEGFEKTVWSGEIEIPELWDNSESKCTKSHMSPPQKAPVISADGATEVSGTTATLNGSAELNGLEVENYRFEWGLTTVSEHKGPWQLGSNLKFGATEKLTGLERNKTYRFRLVTRSTITSPEIRGAVRTFTTVPVPPTATLSEPTNVEAGKATLHGTVNPNGFATKYRFEWGESPACGNATEWKELIGSTSQAVEATISGLKGQRAYCYRLFAESSEGTVKPKGEFATPDWRPSVSAGAVSASTEAATLKATINPNGFATEYHFDWGTQKEFEEGKYGHRMPLEGDVGIGSGMSNVGVSQPISGLEANKPYHFRVVATNSEGGKTEDRPFRSQSLFKSAFGGTGSAAGNLAAPRGVATDKAGNVWVADTAHNRIQEFNPKGEFIRQFGALGSGDGEFNSPRGIAVSSVGNVYVADSGNNRVQEFSSEGKFIAKWGSEGTGNGQFRELQALAIDPEGHVWTVEGGGILGNNRVQKFSSEGAYLWKFGQEGTETGQLKHPEGIAVDSAGNVWVADTSNNRVQEFKWWGSWVRTVTGTGAEALSSPRGLAFDAEGKLWVSDSGNDRMERFTPEGTYLSQFGSPGNNNGQLAEPRGVAIDATGNVWIADTGNNRIQESTPTEFLRALGGTGSGAGNLAAPRGVATDKAGNVWVADTAHNRVQEFSSKGEFIRQFGALGSANGEFNSPRGIAVNQVSGNVYVADSGNNRVQEFSSEGKFIAKWGSEGAGNGQFRELQALTIDGEGHVWTVEGGGIFGNDRVQEFSAEGTYITQFGKEGAEAGQLKHPEGLAVDAAGNVWVADTENNRVQEFKPSGLWVRTITGSGAEALSSPRSLSFDAEGRLWISDSGNDRLERFTAEGTYLAQFGSPGNNNGQFAEPRGVAIDANGNIWIADAGNNRIQESTPTEIERVFGGTGSGAGNLAAPRGVATDKAGNVWVADTAHNRVQEFNSKGEFIRQFGALGSANGEFDSPLGVAVNQVSGNVYVADSGNDRVQEFSGEGKFIGKWGSEGSGNGQFNALQGIAIDPEGHVWALEGGGILGNDRVQEFSAEGAYITQFGKEGTEAGQLRHPEGIAVDSAGNVWIADTENNRIQEFKPSGELVRTWGIAGSEAGQLSGPRGIAFDSEGDLWVADTGNDRLQAFTSTGTYLVQFGSPGNNSGQLAEPRAIAPDSTGSLWIADTGNDRTQKWGS